MLKYIRDSLKESELEDKIIKNSELIESGLIYLEHQRITQSGRLDALFVDNSKRIVIAELKVLEDTNMLMQALDYFDFVLEKIEFFANAYKKYNIDTSKYPRVMLIAPTFSPALMNRCKWINQNISISLIQYQYIKFEKGNDSIVFIPQEIPSEPKKSMKKPMEIDELLSYIKNATVREFANKILDDSKKIAGTDKLNNDHLNWGLSIKYNGKVLFYWEPRQSSIRISTWNDDDVWEGINVTNKKEYGIALKRVKNMIDYYKSEK